MLPFKNGPFKMAIETGVPVVPVTFLDNWKRFPNDGRFRGQPGKTRVVIHAPIDSRSYTEDQLKERTFTTINKTLKKDQESLVTAHKS